LTKENELRLASFNNVISSIDIELMLPDKVFVEKYSVFRFFQSDRMFVSSFINIVQEILKLEESAVCCLINFSMTNAIEHNEAAGIFIDATSKGDAYEAQLRLGGPAAGWLFGVDRYGCASNKGEWSIYCEKQSDIAVIGLQDCIHNRFASPLEKLHAETIDFLAQQGSAAPFPFNILTPEWKKGLIGNYAKDSLSRK